MNRNQYIPSRLVSADYLANIEREVGEISKRKTLATSENTNKLLKLRDEYASLLANGGTTEDKADQLNRIIHALVEATIEHNSQRAAVKSTVKITDASTNTDPVTAGSIHQRRMYVLRNFNSMKKIFRWAIARSFEADRAIKKYKHARGWGTRRRINFSNTG